MSRNDEKLKQLLSKLRTLAERGVGGEKATAQAKLEKLLADNNLTEQDLEEDAVNYYLFSYTFPYRQKLLAQIIYKVVGVENFHMYKTKGTRNKLGVYCTAAQKLEIELDFEFYSNLLDEEIETLTAAFIAKQDIYPEDVPCKSLDIKELTQEELDKYAKIEALKDQISKRNRPSGYIEVKGE